MIRYLYPSLPLGRGGSIKALPAYLGHSDLGFTLRTHTHLMPFSEDRTREAIDQVWGRETGTDGPATANDDVGRTWSALC